jgi:WXG100 family type VII secretion target
MMDIVNGMNSVWQGDAAKAYDTKFKGLQDDMDKIFRMVQEHSKDLDEMASQYTSAEQANAQAAQALSADIVS